MGDYGVFDRQLVQTEFVGGRQHLRLTRAIQADPGHRVWLTQQRAVSVGDRGWAGDALPIAIDRDIDDAVRDSRGWRLWRRHPRIHGVLRCEGPTLGGPAQCTARGTQGPGTPVGHDSLQVKHADQPLPTLGCIHEESRTAAGRRSGER